MIGQTLNVADIAPEPRLELRVPNDRNAFTSDFLDALDRLDDAVSPRDAQIPGPWKIFQEGVTHAIYSQWADVHQDEPLGSFLDRSPALRFWAALAANATPRTLVCREEPGLSGLEVVALQDQGFDVLGTLQVLEPERLVAHFETIDALARNPFALALVLESAGSQAIQHVGEILIRRAKDTQETRRSEETAR